MPPPAPAADLLRAGLARRGDRRQPAGHRLDVGDAERLVGRGHREQRARGGCAPAPRRRAAGRRTRRRSATPSSLASARSARQLGPVADDEVAQRRMAVAQSSATARSTSAWRLRAMTWPVVTTVGAAYGAARPEGRSVPSRTTRVARAPSARQRSSIPPLLASTRRARPSAARTASAPAGEARRGVEDVAAVDGDDERRAQPGAADRIAGRHGVVRVDEVEGEAPAQRAQRDRQRRRGPAPPAAVRRRPRRRDERDVGDLDAVERRARRLGQRAGGRARGGGRPAARVGPRRQRAVQHEHAHVGAGVARGDRLAVRPEPEHRVRRARIELRDDGDLHPIRRDQRAWARVTYGRSARNACASATAAARS